MTMWRIHTETGSTYEIREFGGEWRLSSSTRPSSASAADLRGTLIAIAQPIPWPPCLGCRLMLIMEWAPGHLEVRSTSAVVRIEESMRGEGG